MMSEEAITVIDAVLDEWTACFDGPPEAQYEALDFLLEARDSKPPELVEQLRSVHELPRSDWPDAVMKLWREQR